jgi:hypothetical protein
VNSKKKSKFLGKKNHRLSLVILSVEKSLEDLWSYFIVNSVSVNNTALSGRTTTTLGMDDIRKVKRHA